MFDSIHEECGIFGIYGRGTSHLPSLVYYGLFALQHRGQESTGIAVSNGSDIRCHKAMGLVSEVYSPDVLKSLEDCHIAIGHNRYSTTGSSVAANAQPLVSHYSRGTLAICHNGNLTNCDELKTQLESEGAIFRTTVDSEVIAYLVARLRNTSPDLETAVSSTMKMLKGGFALLVMSREKLIAARDPLGIKPLVMGRLDDSYVFASESCALDSVGAEFVRDIKPGEIVICDDSGVRSVEPWKSCGCAKCIFEYIYFARSDSRMDGISVYESRLKAGALLARQYPVDADIVIGVPESGIDAAMGYSMESGISYVKGFMRNGYVGRTFIKPSQEQRTEAVRIKLNPISAAVKGKRVIMIDDSIVRGTTIANIVRMLRQAGATEVHVRISSPPFMHPCFYGTDVPSEDRLIACHHTIDEIRDMIGADSLGYLKTETLCDMIGEKGHDFCDACFTGNYPAN